MFTTAYTLRPATDDHYTVVHPDGNVLTSPLPLEAAADAVRCFENGSHFDDLRWTLLTQEDMPAVLAALGHPATQTVEVEVYPNGTTGTFEVETVDVADLRRGDQVLCESRSGTFFVHVPENAFRTYHTDPRTGVRIDGNYLVVFGAARSYVQEGTVYRRAVAPRAVTTAQDAARRANMAALMNLR